MLSSCQLRSLNADLPSRLVELRRQALEKAKEIGLPTLRVVNGLVLENFISE